MTKINSIQIHTAVNPAILKIVKGILDNIENTQMELNMHRYPEYKNNTFGVGDYKITMNPKYALDKSHIKKISFRVEKISIR